MHIVPRAEPPQPTVSEYHFSSTPVAPSGIDSSAVSALLATLLTLSGLGLGITNFWAATLADLNVERETAAQTELKRLQACLNPANH